MPEENTTQSNFSDNNWSDNLLVKEDDGKLHFFNSEAKNSQKIAPLDDSFAEKEKKSENKNIQSASDFVFHPQDQEEIEQSAGQAPLDDSQKYSIEKISQKIIDENQLKFDQQNKGFFVDVLWHFFRNRRNVINTRQALADKVLSDGQKLADQSIDTIMSVIKDLKGKIESKGGLVVKMSEIELGSPNKNTIDDGIDEKIDEKAQSEINKALSEMGEIDSKTSDSNFELGPGVGKAQAQSESESKDSQEKKEIPVQKKSVDLQKTAKPEPSESGFEIPQEKQAKPAQGQENEQVSQAPQESDKVETEASDSLPKVARPSQAAQPKHQVTDVQQSSQTFQSARPNSLENIKLTGPVQELKMMNLVNFRRIGSSAQERADKIKEKIDVLEQDSYTRKAQGIAAWRQSPIYNSYLEIGTESMSQGIEVSDLIDQYKSQNKETLDMEEFSAISDLNKHLRF